MVLDWDVYWSSYFSRCMRGAQLIQEVHTLLPLEPTVYRTENLILKHGVA